MLIEDINSNSVKAITKESLYALRVRLQHLYKRYLDIEKSDSLVTIDWDNLDNIQRMLDSEMSSRGLFISVLPIVKSDKWNLCKPYYRIFSVDDLRNTPLFNKADKVIVDTKFDGCRTKILIENRIRIITDPADTETPDKTSRLPILVTEFKSMNILENTEFDGELVMIQGNECLHRTAVNALINGKFDPTDFTKLAHLYIFDILMDSGKNTRAFPLKERIELLSKFKDTEHIHFDKPSTFLGKPSLSYVTNSADIPKVITKLMNQSKSGNNFPKFIAEGVMVKLLDAPYQTPENHGWLKWKEKFELDALVVGKRETKTSGTFNYDLAVGPISKEWADAISEKDKNFVTEYNGEYYNLVGKSDSTNQKVSIGEILRVASEDVNMYETDNPQFQYYGCYVSIVLQTVPEKSHSDDMVVLERLSEMTPKRKSFTKGITDDVRESIRNGSIPKEIYDKWAKPNEPLPKEFYPDYREGDGFLQSHIRGILDEEMNDYKSGTRELWEIFVSHSIHLDLRIDFGFPILIQFVFTDNDVDSLIRFLTGATVTNIAGKSAIAHSMMVVKPSAEEPQETLKKNMDESASGAIDVDGAKALEKIQILSSSYFIEKGGIGATPYTNSWMGTIWTGHIKAGCQRCMIGDTKMICRDDRGFIYRREVSQIVDRKENVEILTPSGFVKIKNYIKIPAENILSIKLFNGSVIHCDPNHPSLVYRDGNLTKIPALNINVGDEIPIDSKGYDGIGGSYELGRFIGLFLAEGTLIQGRNEGLSFSLHISEDKLSNFISDFATRWASNVSITKHSTSNSMTIFATQAGSLVGLIKQFVKENKSLRNCVFGLSRECRKGIINGFEEGDGDHSADLFGKSYISITQGTPHKKLIEDIQHLLFSIGEIASINSWKSQYKKGGDKVYWIHRVSYNFGNNKMGSWTIIDHKGEKYIKVKEIRINDSSILESGIANLYDIELESDHRIILSNGIITSNSDLHELFMFPDKETKILDGRLVIKALKGQDNARWEAWMAMRDPKPMDPILHHCTSHYYPIKAEEVKGFGRESYSYGGK